MMSSKGIIMGRRNKMEETGTKVEEYSRKRKKSVRFTRGV